MQSEEVTSCHAHPCRVQARAPCVQPDAAEEGARRLWWTVKFIRQSHGGMGPVPEAVTRVYGHAPGTQVTTVYVYARACVCVRERE